MKRRLPDFVIVGVMRSGTSTLNHLLRSHPFISMARQKEVHFFDWHFDRGLDWYRGQFEAGPETRVIGEATPNYCHDRRAIERIAADLPTAKLIVMLRDPIDRAWSHYWHNRARGKEPLSFTEAIEAEPERLARNDMSRAWYSYVDRGFYGAQIERILTSFGRESVGIFFYDDLASDPEALWRQLLAFLGLPACRLMEDPAMRVNAYTEFRSARARRIGRTLPRPLRSAIGRFNTKRAAYPRLAEEVRADLISRYAADTHRLTAIMGYQPPWTTRS